jgi:hypothetical protein
MAVEEGHRDLELSRVFALTVAALSKRPFTALILAAVVVYLPNFMFVRSVPPPPDAVFSYAFAAYVFGSIAVMSLAVVFSGWMAVQFVGAADLPLVAVMKRAPVLYITDSIVTLVAIIGVFALLIPGLLWGLACAVVIPAAAIERLGVTQAISRSFELTENRRWAILGFSIAVLAPPSLAIGLLELALNDWRIFPEVENPFITNVSRPITDTLQMMWGAALGAALYVELLRLPLGQVAAPPPD